jgi:N-acyl homoserine lactone hydrolase
MTAPITVMPIRVASLLVGEEERLPVFVHVIEHPDGRILWTPGSPDCIPRSPTWTRSSSR